VTFLVSFSEMSCASTQEVDVSHVRLCTRPCMVHTHIPTVVYIREGGREVTRQGFNGILFTGFVPRLGKHSVGADPSGRLSSLVYV